MAEATTISIEKEVVVTEPPVAVVEVTTEVNLLIRHGSLFEFLFLILSDVTLHV